MTRAKGVPMHENLNMKEIDTTGHRDSRLRALIYLREKQRRMMEGSLHSFVRGAWPLIEPGRQFDDNWHLHAICDHLEAVTRGDIKRLVINVPFRTSKSTFVSVAWPAWTWLHDPSHQWLTGSYAEKLAIRDSLKMRRLVTSTWFQDFWPDKVKLAGDQNEKRRFQNTQNGYRIAFGMTGGVMGDGGDTLVIDDPHDRHGANSEVQRETALTTYDEALITRLNDPNTSPIVIIMQRLHESDLAGHVLKEGGWEHLMLPMEYEQDRHCRTSIGFSDPRKTDGELLWPSRFSAATVTKLKTNLGEYGTSGQLQQRPSPAGGGTLKSSTLRLWPWHMELPHFEHIIQSYDTALTDTTSADDTAHTAWGVFTHTMDGEKRVGVMLLDAFNEKMGYPALRKRVFGNWKDWVYGFVEGSLTKKGRKADALLVEEKGSGISVLQDLRASNIPAVAYNPGRASKTARAELTAPHLEAGAFWVMESKKEAQAGRPGQPVGWAKPLMHQMDQFPNGEHDDLVDTLTQTSIYLTRTQWLELPVVEPETPDEVDYAARRRANVNPYDQ